MGGAGPRAHVGRVVVATLVAAALLGCRPRLLQSEYLGTGPVLIVAPHPDDETIAAGGLISGLIRRGIRVHVVFVTDGDGWPWAVEATFGARHPTAGDFQRLGALRRDEARRATAELGLLDSELTFLGYPDGGLSELPMGGRDTVRPYRSPFTGRTRPARRSGGSARRNVRADVVADIEEIVRTTVPRLVVLPHPDDVHPDHAAVAGFVTEALAVLGHGGSALPPRTLGYLVHHPLWPPSRAAAPDGLPPPDGLVRGTWTSIALEAPDRQAKSAALEAYTSQLAASREFLERFLTRTEVFVTDPLALRPLRVADDPQTPIVRSKAPRTTSAAK